MTRQELLDANFIRIYFVANDFWDLFIENIDHDMITVSNIHNGQINTYNWWEKADGQIAIYHSEWNCVVLPDKETLAFLTIMGKHHKESVVEARNRAKEMIESNENRAIIFSELTQRVLKKMCLEPTEMVG